MFDFVVPDTYAAPSDLETWTGTAPPANAVSLLRACSALVFASVRLAIYATDTTTGLPSDPNILQCMMQATCIQAAAWIKLGIDPDLAGVIVPTVKKTKKIGSASVEYADAEAAAAARQAAQTSLVPAAYDKLRSQNLISHWPSREYGYGSTPGIWPNLL